MNRITKVLLIPVLLLVACGGANQEGDTPNTEAEVVAKVEAEISPREEKPENPAVWKFASYWKTDFTKASVDFEEIHGGGPARDGIKPIYDPVIVLAEEAADWMIPLEPMIVVEVGGEARAYSQSLLMYREVVNDTLGGRPIAVTW